MSEATTTEKFAKRIDAVFLPVSDLETSLAWYQDLFGFKLRWKNQRFAGLGVAPNCGFHLVQVEGHMGNQHYAPFNFVVDDLQAVKQRFEDKGVKVSEISHEPTRFDFWDPDMNILTIIQEGT